MLYQKHDSILWRPSLAKFKYIQVRYSVFYQSLVIEQLYLPSTTSEPLKILCVRYPCVTDINIQKPTATMVTCLKSPTEANQSHGYKATITQLSIPNSR